ncbi:MAG TPA: UDP-3-O-(3-hydroxymyristoyl)glucosamine N-acyltransferase [Pyrinomonadaceae bacterium]|nr:UDP-3-O-(3-hydroxymyristoyl)glucosamine N-acyltransferase [Pyrinomonadaceae bacterium]
MKLSELAAKTEAQFQSSDGDIEITGAAGLDQAEPGQVTFLSNPRYTPKISSTGASAIFVADNVEVPRADLAILRANDPYLAFTRALIAFNPAADFEPYWDPTAVIDSSSRVPKEVFIDAHVSIGKNVKLGNRVRLHANVTIYDNVTIGDDTEIHSGVAVRENTILGNRVIIHNNAVIGCDGFGFAKDEKKRWLKIPQVGRVVIEDDVEIGAGTTIDKSSTDETRIKRGAKLDNLVQIGHSCTVGEDSLICAQVGLAGSSHIGNRVILAGQVGIAGHLKIGDDVVLTAKSATSHDVPDGKVISGIPGFDNKDWLRSTAAFRRLGEIVRTIRGLEKRVDEIEKRKSD